MSRIDDDTTTEGARGATGGATDTLADPDLVAIGAEGAVILPDDAPRRGRAMPRGRWFGEMVLPPLLLGSVLVGLWYAVTYLVLDERRRFLLEAPHRVVLEGFLEWDTFSEILLALWSSTKVAMIGLVISILLGFALAIVMSQAKVAERAIFPYMVTLQAIPILALVPLIQFWWGTGQTSRVVVCIIISVFPIIVNTLFGLLSADKGLHDLFTLHGASRVTRLRKLMFPAALPAIFAGLRISAGLSVIGAIVGDFFFGKGDKGIGQLLRKFANDLSGEALLASVIMSSVLGVTVFLIFGWLQTRFIGKWHDAAGGGGR
ncbi:MAG: ABC transporter permease [Acidimicrobiales bacterium]